MLRYVLPLMISLPLFTDHTKAIEQFSVKEVLEVGDVFKTPQKEYIDVVATFYTARCKGCIGITKTGHYVKSTIYEEGKRVIAVDPNVIPLRSLVMVELENGDSFEAIASDTGGNIINYRVDILVKTEHEAFQLGRQKAKITILEDGNGRSN